MLRLFYRLLFWPATQEPISDCEFDIEGFRIIAIERSSKTESLICYIANAGKRPETHNYTIPCSIEKHEEFIRRFRKKMSLPRENEAIL